MMSIEKRRKKRRECDVRALIMYRGRSINAQIANISVEGGYVKVQALRVPRGTLIGLDLEIDNIFRQISGLVVRQQNQGLGIVFRTPQPELCDHLFSQPRQRSSQPGSALRQDYA